MKRIKKLMAAWVMGVGVMAGSGVQAQTIDQALVIVSSGELQTQGMAMVLSNTMQAKGAHVNVLLCDKAGDLALKDTNNPKLAPKGVTPEMMLKKLQKGGGKVQVCALYLPNSEHQASDLIEGVDVATPPAISSQMLDPAVRVFNF